MTRTTLTEVLLTAVLGTLPVVRRANRWYLGLSVRNRLGYAVVLACLGTVLAVVTRPEAHGLTTGVRRAEGARGVPGPTS